MHRRRFITSLATLGLAPLGGCGEDWRLVNECRSSLQPDAAGNPLLRSAWNGLDPGQVWDCHVHLFGTGDSGSDLWVNPEMASLFSPLQYVQRGFYLNAGCMNEAPGQADRSIVARLDQLMAGFPSGVKAMLLAFDWCHDARGQRLPECSTFHVPNAYARQIAQANPERFEWIASIHPYRPDALDALAEAVATGARAIKWLPSAMAIDPASPQCAAFCRALARHDLPLLTHGGAELAVAGAGAKDFGNPLRLRSVLDHGVRVVVAHAASHGDDIDLDQGRNAARVSSFSLFARLFDDEQYRGRLFADTSALGQPHRTAPLKTLLERLDWHARLLYGSDYPLPGVVPLYRLGRLVDAGLIAAKTAPVLRIVRDANPLLFAFLLQRHVRLGRIASATTSFIRGDSSRAEALPQH